MKGVPASLALGFTLVLSASALAFANNPHAGGSGQPGQSCQSFGTPAPTPGQTASARGSPFNPSGVSGGVYANAPLNHTNPKSVSQYDVACFQHMSH
jgi:hypothetical protein